MSTYSLLRISLLISVSGLWLCIHSCLTPCKLISIANTLSVYTTRFHCYLHLVVGCSYYINFFEIKKAAMTQSPTTEAKKLFETKKPAVTESPTSELRCHSRVRYHLCTGLLRLMVSIDTGVCRALVRKNHR